MTARTRDQQRTDAIRERLAAATPGPWYGTRKDNGADVRGLPENTTYDYRGDGIATGADAEFGACKVQANAELIAHAPTDLQWCLARIAELEDND